MFDKYTNQDEAFKIWYEYKPMLNKLNLIERAEKLVEICEDPTTLDILLDRLIEGAITKKMSI